MDTKVMTNRIGFGAMLIAALVAIFFLDSMSSKRSWQGLPMAMIFFPILIIAFFEFRRMTETFEIDVLVPAGLFGICILSLSPFLAHMGVEYAICRTIFGNQAVTVSVTLIAIFFNQMMSKSYEKAFTRMGFTLLACIYIGICGGMIFTLRMIGGVGFLVMFLASVKCTDIGAYFTGTFIGKHKIVPRLSPGKTWEGLMGGIAAAAIVGLIWSLTGDDRGTWWQCMLFSAVIGLAGQFGDICESLLKRSADVKDSGKVLPEFGGVLDIIDSPLIAAPVAIIMASVIF